MAAPELAPMRWWHVPAVHALERELFDAEAWTAEMFIDELAQPGRHYLVALDEAGMILGYAGALVFSSSSDVQTIAVASQAQGRGVGARLLQALLSHAESSGAENMMLEVRSDNTTARRLYEGFGFSRIAVRKNYYAKSGVDAIVMAKEFEKSR